MWELLQPVSEIRESEAREGEFLCGVVWKDLIKLDWVEN